MADTKTVALKIAIENAQQSLRQLKEVGDGGAAAASTLIDRWSAAGAAVERSTGQMTGSLRNVNSGISQFSFQATDFVTQLQSGTNGFIAFTQQAGQFAGAINPLAGAVVALGGAFAGAIAAGAGFNSEIKEAPSLLDKLVSSLTAGKDALDAFQKKRGELSQGDLSIVAGQAKIEGQGLAREQGQRSNQLVQSLQQQIIDEGLRQVGAVGADQESAAFSGDTSAYSAALQQAQQAADRLGAAVRTGDRAQVETLINQMGLQNNVATATMVQELLDTMGRKSVADAIGKQADTGANPGAAPAPPVQDFGSPNLTLGLAQGANLPDENQIKAQIQAEEQRIKAQAQAQEQLAKKRQQVSEAASREGQSITDQIFSAKGNESAAEGIERVNRSLDESIKRINDIKSRGGLTPQQAETDIAGAKRNAAREIAGIQEREQAEKAQDAAKREREADKARAQSSVVAGAQEELEFAIKIREAKQAELDTVKQLSPEQVRAAQQAAAAAEVEAATRRSIVEVTKAASAQQVNALEREVAVAEEVAKKRRESLTPTQQAAVVQVDGRDAAEAERVAAAKRVALEAARAEGGQAVQRAQQEAEAAERTARAKREALQGGRGDDQAVQRAQEEVSAAERLVAARRAEVEASRTSVAATSDRIDAAKLELQMAESVLRQKRDAASVKPDDGSARREAEEAERVLAAKRAALESARSATEASPNATARREAEAAERMLTERRETVERLKAAGGAEAARAAQAEVEAAERLLATRREARDSAMQEGAQRIKAAQDELALAEQIAQQKKEAAAAAPGGAAGDAARREAEEAETRARAARDAVRTARTSAGQDYNNASGAFIDASQQLAAKKAAGASPPDQEALRVAQAQLEAAEKLAALRREALQSTQAASGEQVASLEREVQAAERVATAKRAAVQPAGVSSDTQREVAEAEKVVAVRREALAAAQAQAGQGAQQAQRELADAEKVAAVKRDALAAARAAAGEGAKVTQQEVAAAEKTASERRAALEAAKASSAERIAGLQREAQAAAAAAVAARRTAAAAPAGADDPAVAAARQAEQAAVEKRAALDRARTQANNSTQEAEREVAALEANARAQREAVKATQEKIDGTSGEIDASRKVQLQLESERRVRAAAKTLSGQQLEDFRRLEAGKLAEAIATEDLTAKIKAENEERERRVKIEGILADLQLKANAGANKALTDRQSSQLDKGVELQALGATPQEIVRAMNDQGTITDQQAQDQINDEYVRQQTDILLEPWRQLASQTSSIVAGVFDEFLATGRVSMDSLAESLATGTRGILSGFLGNLVTAPLNQAISQLGPELNKALAEGGSVSGVFSDFARRNPLTAALGAGAIGMQVGNTFTAATGGNQTGSSLGGLAGGVAGGVLGSFFGPMGTVAGAGIGSAAGGIFGGMFGGEDKDNDRARLDFYTRSGVTYEDRSSSPQNRGVVNAFAKEVDSLVDALSGLGANVAQVGLQFASGNESGLEFQGKEYSDQESLMNAVIRFIGQNTTGLSANQQTVLRTTKAGSVQEVAGDLAFAEQLDRTRQNMGPFRQQLEDLKDSFQAMRVRAEQLGLATEGLNAAYARQRKEILDTARDQIKSFTGNRTQYGEQIDSVRDQAEELQKMGKELGLSTAGVAAAMRRQIADIRDAAKDQVESFTGSSNPVAQALRGLAKQREDALAIARDLGFNQQDVINSANDKQLDIRLDAEDQINAFVYDQGQAKAALLSLRDQFEELKASAEALGRSTGDIDRAYQREQRRVREGVNRSIRAETQGQFVAALDALTEKFDTLRQGAYDVGRGVDDLNQAYDRQVRELDRAARAQLSQAEQGYKGDVRGLQDLFSGLIDPIKQALGPFGLSNGIAAPQATVQGGLDQFREQLALARGGDVDAIQGLTGLAQNTIGAAREYGASGKDFTEVFMEVNKGLTEVQSRLQDRQIEALRGIEFVGRETLDEMVKLRREGIENVRLELEQLRFEVRQLADRRAA